MTKSENKRSRVDVGQSHEVAKVEGVIVLGFVLLALVLRLYLSTFKPSVEWDGFYYTLLGKNLISGDFAKGLSTYWSPLYPVLIGLSSLIFGDLKFAGTFVSIVAGSLLVIPVYLIVLDFYGRRAAHCGAFLVAICPSLADYSTDILTEATYTLLFMFGILAGWFALSRGKNSYYLLTGLAFGACYLTRPEAFAYIILMLMITLGHKLLHQQLRSRKTLVNVSILLAGFLVLSLPYLIFLHRQTGQWMLSEKVGINLRGGVRLRALNEAGELTPMDRLAGNEPEGEEVAPESIQAGARRRPRDYGKLLVESVGAFSREYKLLAEIFPPVFAVLSVIGLFSSPWSRERAGRETYLALFLISTLIGYAIAVTVVRYLVPVLPILIVWAAKGCVDFEQWLKKTLTGCGAERSVLLRKPGALQATLAALLVLSLIPSIYSMSHSGKWDRGAGREAVGLWLKNQSATAPTVLAAGPWPVFYAGGQYLSLPDEEYLVVVDYAKRKKVDYILIEQDLGYMHPRFMPSLRKELAQNSSAAVELVYTYDEVPRHNIFVFKLRESP